MNDFSNFRTPTRRAFVKGIAGAVAGSTFLNGSGAAWGNQDDRTLGDLHGRVAAHAKNLAAGRDVTLAILQPVGSLGNVKPVGDRFTKDTGIAVTYIESALDEINTRMMVDALSGQSSFDLALPATFGLPDLVESGALHDLDEFAAKYEPENFQSDALFSIGDYYKDRLYGYQTDGDTYLMFYNRDWLNDPEERKKFADTHGYELAVPQTWAELDAMMAFFQRPDDDKFGGALFRTQDYIAWEWWIRFHAKGFWPFDNELEPQINNAAGVAALEELIEATNYLYPQARSNGLFENWEAFSKGNIFCNIGWGGTQKYLNGPKSDIKGRLAFGPTPGGMVNGQLLQTPYFNWGWNYTVSRTSAEPEIAYLFALYACSPAMSTVAVRDAGGYFDPFREEHYDDPQIVETYSQEFLDAHKASMRDSIPDLYLRGQGEYFDALRENIVAAQSGEMTAQKALDTTAKQWRHTSRRMGWDNQKDQWAFLRDRYPLGVRNRLA